jgi:hypothetical protein
MKSTVLAAAVIAAVVVGAPGARAADLEYGAGDRYSSPYDDPRYRDLYEPSPRYTERYAYEERTYRPPVPPNHVYRDDDYAPRRYAENYRFGGSCLPRHEIRQRLRDQGWADFHDLEIRPDIAVLRARGSRGHLYDLSIDRCTGEIVHARPLEHFVPGPFAYGPRRWARPYY